VCGDGGGGGIRTPGSFRPNGFQDRRDRPLCHPSGGRDAENPPDAGGLSSAIIYDSCIDTRPQTRRFNRVAFEKHLLIDAANVIHAWPELHALMKRDRDAARSQLIQRAGAVHDAESVRVTVVIDGRGPEIVVEHPSQLATLTVIYTPSSMTADDVIEKMVGRSTDASLCEVATGDQAERSTIEAMGAVWLPPADLLARVERAERRVGSKVAELNRTNAKDWLRRSS
jgi:uncharacterized protein